MGILPKNFDQVAQFAGTEVYMRGIGARGEYNYSIHDVLAVAWAHEGASLTQHKVTDATIYALTVRRQARALNRAYVAFKEKI